MTKEKKGVPPSQLDDAALDRLIGDAHATGNKRLIVILEREKEVRAKNSNVKDLSDEQLEARLVEAAINGEGSEAEEKELDERAAAKKASTRAPKRAAIVA